MQALVGGSWREAHLLLAPNHMLDLYADSTKSTRLDQVGLTLPHCRVSVQSSVAYTEVFHLSTVDRPYTFKLTVQTQGQPEKVLLTHHFVSICSMLMCSIPGVVPNVPQFCRQG